MSVPVLTEPNEPATIREILNGRRTWRVPLAITTQRTLHGDDLEGLTVDEIVEKAREARQKHKGEKFDVEIIASTANLVRDDAIVPTAAWDIEDFLRNPIILFAHSRFMPPIALSVATELRRGPGEMRQFWLFDDLTQLSREIHALFEVGSMRAASVGFIIRSFHRPDDKELAKLRKKFPRVGEFTWIVDLAELLETSAVPVPADPGAIAVEGRSLEEDLERVYAEMGLRGPGDKETFSLGGLAADQLIETRQHWSAAVRFLASECARGNADACACLTQEGSHAMTDDNERTPIPFSVHGSDDYAVAPKSATWSGPGEVAKMPSEAKPLRLRHAWRDAKGDADVKATYKFPHHRASPAAPVVFRALAAGFARLGQAKIPDSERDGVAAHIGRHMKVDFDVDPPERAAVDSLVARFTELLEEHGDETAPFYRAALPLAIEKDDVLGRLGAGDGGEGFAAVLAEARWRAGAGPDPMDEIEHETEDGDGEFRLVDMAGDELEIVGDEE